MCIRDREIAAVDEWIRKNVRTGKKILHGHTSYGMKHMLEHDTGIYLTNNEFKDASLLAGYQTVNPKDLNWKMCIRDRTASEGQAVRIVLWLRRICRRAESDGRFGSRNAGG